LPNDTLRSETFTPLDAADADALLALLDATVGAPALEDALLDLLPLPLPPPLLPHAPTAVARPTATAAAVKPRCLI
jgi:hypothetical protein